MVTLNIVLEGNIKMPKNIEPRLRTIGQYLTLNSQEIFVIPEYQRGYSWEITQCENYGKIWNLLLKIEERIHIFLEQ